MICVVAGTTGELIKLAPLLVRIRERGGNYVSATTGQQVQQIPTLLDLLELPQPDLWLGRGTRGRDLRSNSDIPRWLAGAARSFARERPGLRRRLRGASTQPLVLVHGDTMTTVLGALMGRMLRVPVAHVEGGLRSFDVLHPFPEELNRRVASRVASIHYAPGAWAAGNLRRGEIVDTGTNTIRDSLDLCPSGIAIPVDVPEERFGLVSLHRFELINDRRLLTATLRELADHARDVPLLFIDHPVTVAAIAKFKLGGLFDDRLRSTPRLSFFGFVELLKRSAFLITDSGGSQEECFYLDRPCLVHRKRTERREGLGENVVVSGYRNDLLNSFLEDPTVFRRRSPLPSASPSGVILGDLTRRGVI
jgi:UDP-N-acetylglucosamine 2-epimerase (non-hydrolysing)